MAIKKKRINVTMNEYANIHMYLITHFKKKGRCSSCGTAESKRFEWALLKGRSYSKNIEDYIELCVKCHRKYDVTDEFKRKTGDRMRNGFKDGTYKRRLPSNDKIVLQCDLEGNLIKEWPSVAEAARQLNLSRHPIYNCAYGTRKFYTGCIWKYKSI